MSVPLYENEEYVNHQVPIRIWNHVYEKTDIFTRLHWHRSIELNLVTKGRIAFKVDGQTRIMQAGDVNLINSGVLHSNIWVDKNDYFEGVAVLISKSFLESWLEKDVYLQEPADPLIQKEISAVILELGHIKKKPDEVQKILLMEKTYRLLFYLKKYCIVPNYTASEKKNKAVENIKKVVNYIDFHYKENITLADAAGEVNYSTAYLSRLFKENIGYNFYEYVQLVRLTNATLLLRENKDILLIDCALECGFPNVKSFIATFKKQYGCTPSEWKNKITQ